MTSKQQLVLALCGAALLGTSSRAFADNVTVNATDSVYAVGTNAGAAPSYGATAPTGIAVLAGTTYFTFSASGLVTVNGGTLNDADGVGSVSGEYNTGAAGLSGINSPTAGFIAGVFLGPGGPTGSTPATLDFTAGGIGTSFSSLSPELDQVFFIGDGMTGDGTGALQDFYAPTGATELYLGLTDACRYSGSPSCYDDNSGSFAVTLTQDGNAVPPPVSSVTPEPSSLVLLGTGTVGILGAARRRFAGQKA